MTLDGQRSLRLFFKFGLLVSLPLAGYLWASMGVSPWTIGLGLVCLVMALGAEGLASSEELRLNQLKALAGSEEQAFATEAATRDEKIRQMDRVVDTLSNQNHDLRGRLVSLHSEVHRLQEETGHLDLDGTGTEPGGPEPGQQGGDVTDITPLLRR